MRLRNLKNKEEIINSSPYIVKDYLNHKGKWKDLFGNSNPIYLEIGMGKGQFIIENAKKYPNINFIGIEKYDSVIGRALLKIPDGLDNLLVIRADAMEVDEIFCSEIKRLYLNFSDPWPKNRHHLRRLSSKVFLEKYEVMFEGDREIEMRTDNKDLYIYSLISLSEKGYVFKKLSFDLHSLGLPLITTEYEDKFSKNNIPIYYVECSRYV